MICVWFFLLLLLLLLLDFRINERYLYYYSNTFWTNWVCTCMCVCSDKVRNRRFKSVTLICLVQCSPLFFCIHTHMNLLLLKSWSFDPFFFLKKILIRFNPPLHNTAALCILVNIIIIIVIVILKFHNSWSWLLLLPLVLFLSVTLYFVWITISYLLLSWINTFSYTKIARIQYIYDH